MGASSSLPLRRQRPTATRRTTTTATTTAPLVVVLFLSIAAAAVAAPAPAPAPRGAAASPRAAAASPRTLSPGELPPVYGNYCGLQNSPCTDAAFKNAPIDALDAACKRHDQCWCRSGSMDCACDRALLDDARKLLRAPGSPPAAAAMATAVAAYFSVAPCVCRERKFCLPTCGARTGCTWGGPNCRQAVSPGLGGTCALDKKKKL